MDSEPNQYSFEKTYEKKLSTLKAYAEVVLRIFKSNVVLSDRWSDPSPRLPLHRSCYLFHRDGKWARLFSVRGDPDDSEQGLHG
jgi:hypothetical protein